MTVFVDFDSLRRLKQHEFSEGAENSVNTPLLISELSLDVWGLLFNQCWTSFRSKGQEKFLFRDTSG